MLRKTMLVLCVSVLASCSILTGKSDSKIEQVLQPASENNAASNLRRIGAREDPKIVAANGGAYVDDKLNTWLDNIAKTLSGQNDNNGLKYRITILNSPAVNAFALPGGYLYVTRGLLALANDTSEVAAVLAHEMAHVSANHGIKRSEKIESVKLADRVVLDVVSNARAGKIALAANKINLAKFSQNQELQSDALGIRMLGRAGYDPYAAARFLESMQAFARYQKTLSSRYGEQEFLLTHPSTPKRIELARRHARNIGRPGTGLIYRQQYLKSIEGMLFGNSAEEGYVRGRRFSHAGLGITFTVPVGFEIDNKSDAVVISGPDQIAVRFDGVSQPNTMKLDDYLRSGWVNGLDQTSIRLAAVNGLNVAYGKARADGWIFEITLIRAGSQIYRFILAAPKSAENPAAIARKISGTFRTLSRAEKRRLRPLKLKVVQVGANDTIAGIAARMKGVPRKLGLFRLLNRIEPGARLVPGTSVKIVVNG